MVGILLKLKIEKISRLSAHTSLLNYHLIWLLDLNAFVGPCFFYFEIITIGINELGYVISIPTGL